MINITVPIFKTFQYVPSAAVYSGHRVEAHAGQDCFFLTIFSIILFCNRTFRGTNVVYLYFSLPIKQYLNCCRNEIFFSVWVCAILRPAPGPDLRLSRSEALLTLLPQNTMLSAAAAASCRSWYQTCSWCWIMFKVKTLSSTGIYSSHMKLGQLLAGIFNDVLLAELPSACLLLKYNSAVAASNKIFVKHLLLLL